MTIEGWYRPLWRRPSAPYVRAEVYLPRVEMGGPVSFLVDTGADTTTLHPLDINALHIDVSKLDPKTLSRSHGVGGSQNHFSERAVLLFRGSPGGAYYWDGNVDIYDTTQAQPQGVVGLPSLLGRDFLNLCRLDAHPGLEQLLIHPYRTDHNGRVLIP